MRRAASAWLAVRGAPGRLSSSNVRVRSRSARSIFQHLEQEAPMTISSPVQEKFHGSTAVSLTVKDVQKSVAWYQNVVGFGIERTYEFNGKVAIVTVRAGDVRINLNQDDGAKGWDRIKGLGFSISIWTTEDIDGIANRIKASGGTLDSEPVDAPWGARFFGLTDPDGYKFFVLKALAPSA
jgi:uncharacterized glyoxalase superfamily protein PhnB